MTLLDCLMGNSPAPWAGVSQLEKTRLGRASGISGQRAKVPLGEDGAGGGGSAHPPPTSSCQHNATRY